MSIHTDALLADLPTIGPKATPSIPPSEPSVEAPSGAVAEADGSPSAVEQHEAALTVEWAKLSEELPRAKAAEQEAAKHRRQVAAEMDRIKRLLAVHKRLREPIRRKR